VELKLTLRDMGQDKVSSYGGRNGTLEAGDDGAAQPISVDADGLLQRSFGSKKPLGRLIVGSSTSSQASIAARGGGRWRATAIARVLGFCTLQVKKRMI
jgi:hypothetical protein